MIKFFRRIRQKLLSENKFNKYLIYAIGEIILVVFGILIALSINNWNDQRKSEARTKHLLEQIQKELLYNITNSNRVIDFYRNADSLLYRVIHKEVTYEDYKTNYELRTLVTSNESADLVSDAFYNLIDNDRPLSLQEDSIVLKLRGLYGTYKKFVDEYDMKTAIQVDEFLEKLKNEKEWFSLMMEVSDEQIDYFLNDPYYLNEVKYFEIQALQSHLKTVLDFKEYALNIYEILSDYLDLKKDSSIVKNLNKYGHYLGTFEYDSLHIGQIKRENKRFKIDFMTKNDTVVVYSMPIHPDSKTYWTSNHLLGKFIFDDNNNNNNNNVSGFILSNGSIRTEHKKLN